MGEGMKQAILYLLNLSKSSQEFSEMMKLAKITIYMEKERIKDRTVK